MLQLISFKGLYLFIICLDIFRFMTRLPNARYPPCRLPNVNLLGGRHVCSPTPGSRPVGAPTQICSIPGLHGSHLFGMDSLSRSAPTPIFWGADIQKFMG